MDNLPEYALVIENLNKEYDELDSKYNSLDSKYNSLFSGIVNSMFDKVFESDNIIFESSRMYDIFEEVVEHEDYDMIYYLNRHYIVDYEVQIIILTKLLEKINIFNSNLKLGYDTKYIYIKKCNIEQCKSKHQSRKSESYPGKLVERPGPGATQSSRCPDPRCPHNSCKCKINGCNIDLPKLRFVTRYVELNPEDIEDYSDYNTYFEYQKLICPSNKKTMEDCTCEFCIHIKSLPEMKNLED